jgi:transaldolase
MELFIDSADPEEIRTAWNWGIISGVTTNPSLAAKTGLSYRELVTKILEILGEDGVLNLEVVATDYEGMVSEGKALAAIDERIIVKVPCTQEGIKACAKLSSEGILVNVTLIFSANQALLAAKAGAFIVSPFVGRLDDIEAGSGDDVVAKIMGIYENYEFETQVLHASVRDPQHVENAALLGADIATVPFNVLEELIKHPLTDKGLEKFMSDWKEAGLELPV